MEENQPPPKLLSISHLIKTSLPLTGTSSLNNFSSKPNTFPQQKQQQQNTTSNQNPNPKILTSLNYPTIITGTIALPTDENSTCHCFSFSDGTSKVCCYVLDLDLNIIGEQINLLSWNFIPFKCGGNGILEVIRWAFLDSGSTLTRCSAIGTFPLCLSSSRDEVLETRSRVLGRLESVSPVTVVPCTTQNSSSAKNVGGFLAEVLVCKCKLCSSKVSVKTLCSSVGRENGHLFDVSVIVYFFESALSWHPLMSKLVGDVVCVSGLKKKLIYIGNNDTCLMFITSEKAALCRPLMPLGCLPVHRDEIKGKGDFGAYTGIVTGVYMQGMVIELDEKVWLLLSDRLLAPLHPIRVGSVICLRNIHLVRLKFPWTRMLLLGACFRTNINVKSFSPLESQCHIRFQTQSMLGKFIESVTFSASFWLLLTMSSFKKKFAGVLLKTKS